MADPEPASESVKPPTKRRRILDPSAIVPVPIYSNKVSSSLRLKPIHPVFTKDDTTDDMLWSPREKKTAILTLSDSEEDEECVENGAKHSEVEEAQCPSPPPPGSPVQKQSRQVKKKISEIDRKLKAVNCLMSPETQTRTRSQRRRASRSPAPEAEEEEEDVVMVSGRASSSSTREIPLKIRCRTDIHKIPVQSSTPLSSVLTRLSVILEVPPPRLLLLREDVELLTNSTVDELGLGIADILECVVRAEGDKRAREDDDEEENVITIRLQSKDRASSQEFSLRRDAQLGSVFSQYLSKMPPAAHSKVRFHFDGSKVASGQTPAQLDMEDGDIIEVWV